MPEWTDTLPISLNGKRPKHHVPDYHDRFWHDRFWGAGRTTRKSPQWDATLYFEDRQLISLCDAIDAIDVAKMEGIISKGVDINTKGKGNMTLLLRAFYVDEDPGPFMCLLRHKANPNIIAEPPANLLKVAKKAHISWGNAPVNLVSQCPYNRLYEAVFEHGGNPNLNCNTFMFQNRSPLHMIGPGITDGKERLDLLIKYGADLNSRNQAGLTIAAKLVRSKSASGYEMALVVLKAGADSKLTYQVKRRNYRLIHFLAEAENEVQKWPEEDKKHFLSLLDWLAKQGESMEEAKEDLKRRPIKLKRRSIKRIN